MRKLAMLGVLGAALAWNARADDTQEKKQEAKQEVQKAQAEAQKETQEAKADAQKEVGEAQAKASEKVGEARQDAAEKEREAAQEGTATGGMGSTNAADPSRAAAGDMDRKHPVFTKDNWDVEGTVQSASRNSITVRREELPAVKLNVDHNTKIELDGQKVSAQMLKPGQEVKASFNLQNDKPMAVEIKAEKKD
jgi:hypothetical protein